MATADQMDRNGFIWWYRNNNIKGSLEERLKAYLEYIG